MPDLPSIKDIIRSLNELAPSIKVQANGSPATNSHLAHGVPQTNGLASQQNVEAPDRSPSITFLHEPSPQNHETYDFRDAAPAGGEHGHSSPNFLSPKSASYRKRVLPVHHEEDGSQSSSSTKGLQDSAPHSVSTNVVLDVPEWCPPSLPNEPSPGRHTAKATLPTYREESKVFISLPRKEHVKAVAITPSTLQIAILFKHLVCLYSTSGGKEIGQPTVLLPKVDWTKIRLASGYFSVYGLGPSLEKHVSRSLNFVTSLSIFGFQSS